MKLTIEEIPIGRVNAAPYNPRRALKPGDHEYETVRRSLAEFALVEPLVWNRRTGNLVSGHLRFEILKGQGETVVPCSIVDLPLEKEKALNVTLNNPNVGGQWDGGSLATLLREIEANLPDLYDELAMAPLAGEAVALGDEEELGDGEAGTEEGPPAMELLPYEHYDYIVLFFKDSRDFLAAADHFQLVKARVPEYVGKKKIGLARVLDGATYLRRVQAGPAVVTSPPSAAPPAAGPAARTKPKAAKGSAK